jgi:two-component system, response regulator PdtaR
MLSRAFPSNRKCILTASVANPLVVLIVEDEALLRMGAVEMVMEAGFDVVEAGNADEAIAILESRPDIHIVFTDIQMPGSMDGIKLSSFIRRRWPPIKLITTSGRVKLKEGEIPEDAVFIGKPYTMSGLTAGLRALAGPP